MSRMSLHYWLKKGRFSAAQRGVYRFIGFVDEGHIDQVMPAWLGLASDEAAVSHESALELLDLSDVIPDAVHLTIPRYLKHRHAPGGVRLHTATERFWPPGTVKRYGLPVTDPARTVADCAATRTQPEQIIMACQQALERGITTPQHLLDAAEARSKYVVDLVSQAIEAEPIPA